MANSLPWSVKGVDPRTRDAAKAAARRAGMTLGEWLDHKIRAEAQDDGSAPAPAQEPLEQLDIVALSERLAKLSQGQMATSPQAAATSPSFRASTPEIPPRQLEALMAQAAAAERVTRESSARTASALDSIARWIEKTETRLASGERSNVERQERTTNVIADAIRTIGERIGEVERKALESQSKAAARPALNRDGLAAAVTDIRTRQRMLDSDGAALASGGAATNDRRVAALREDLRSLSAKMGAPGEASAAAPAHRATPPADADALQKLIQELGAKLDRLDRADRIDPILKPLARIESEVTRLAQDRPTENYTRFELEIAHLAAKVDALAARGGDHAMLAPVLRDIGELRTLLASDASDVRLGDLSRQVSALSDEVAGLRDSQPDGLMLRGLSQAIEDVRDALLTERFGDPAPLQSLSRQIDSLASKLDSLPVMRPEVISSQTAQLLARLDEIAASGSPASDELSGRIEALIIKLEDAAERQPIQLADRIDSLQQRIEALADHGPAAVTKQIEALAARIETLAASSSLAQMIQEGGNVQVARVDMSPVEEMLRNLAEKIDEAGRPGADSDSFDALERQIAGLASRLDEAVATRSAETGIERTLQDLVRHLQTVREDTAAAAERAARAAMADLGSKAPAATGGFAELSNLVTGLRDTHASSGRETQDAIGTVQKTLDTVLTRLAGLEAELGVERQGSAPVLPPVTSQARPQPPAQGAPFTLPPGVSAGVEDRFGARLEAAKPTERVPEPAAADSLDLPLEPGSGRPRPDGVAKGQDPQSVRQSLIAAARRSAKAAAEAAAAEAANPAEDRGQRASRGGRLKEIMEKRRRPLLLGLAAVILAMGTAHVVTGALKDSKSKAPSKETVQAPAATPAPAAQEPAASEAPSKPADERGSLIAPIETGPAAAQAAPATPALPAASAAAPSLAAPVAALPAAAAPEPVQQVTNIGELPNGLGAPGLRKAALAGDARAVYELATRAADGSGSARDPKLALRLFERAAVAGLAPAQFRLANMFEKGVGTPRDASLAQIWYARAAERGNAKAMHNLAVLYAEGATGKPDYATAIEWFRRAADAGVRDSQYNLAVLLGRGLGAPADLTQSYLWFAVAARQGDDDAARKRDEVAARLNAGDLAAARQVAETWKAKPLEPSANDVAAPAKEWDAEPTAAARKPAKPARS